MLRRWHAGDEGRFPAGDRQAAAAAAQSAARAAALHRVSADLSGPTGGTVGRSGYGPASSSAFHSSGRRQFADARANIGALPDGNIRPRFHPPPTSVLSRKDIHEARQVLDIEHLLSVTISSQ
jgi:hypothetical protein